MLLVKLIYDQPILIMFNWKVVKIHMVSGQSSKWFYERTKGSYQTLRAAETTPARKKKFDELYPKNQKITKEMLAKYHNTWLLQPDIVSKGGKNFVKFMEDIDKKTMNSDGLDYEMQKEEYESIIGKAIIYKTIEKITREEKVEAFKVNVVNYTAALLIHNTAQRIDLNKI